jgi:lysophospholipase L1-like esterase
MPGIRRHHPMFGECTDRVIVGPFESARDNVERESKLIEKRRAKSVGTLRCLTVSAAIALGTFATFGAVQAGARDVSNTPVHVAYYLALGGSGSLGVQPTIGHPKGQPTSSGYANDLLRLERSRGSGFQLVQLGCPGETTGSFLAGGDRCRSAGQSQLADAVSFLQSHANTALVTIDLGFNNVRPCLAYHQVNQNCVLQDLATVRQQLTQILTTLHEAVPSLRIVGVGHYDPYLYVPMHSVTAQSFASASVAVIDHLNETLRSVYSAAGVPMANVSSAFALPNALPTALTNGATVPTDVVRLCALTWVCASPPLGHNSHPNEDGYEVIAEAIADVAKGIS